jgi:AraC-like DNA-binding protein
MRSARAGAPGWDIARPLRAGRLPGVRMAGFSDQTTGLAEIRLVPHPAVTVVVDIGGGLLVDDASGRQQRGSVVAGLAPIGAAGHGLQDFECLQVRLSPRVAHTVLGACAELSGTVAGLDDLWGREAVRIQEQLRAAASWEDRFAIVETVLARRQETSRAVDPEVAFAWGQMVASRGRVRVERLAAEAGWSRKRLWSRFRSQIGLTPKRAARLWRFDHAARLLAAGGSAAVAAADSGYADQSHLHRDVLAFAGMTPAAMAVTPFLAVDDVAWPDALSAART